MATRKNTIENGAGKAALSSADPKLTEGMPAEHARVRPKPAPSAPPTKTATVIRLLKRKHGATLDQLTEATGWQAHTVRAALTGLKKKGHTIERTKENGVSRYRIVPAALEDSDT